MNKRINTEILDKALSLLAGRLEINRSPHQNIIVCGGSSLIATGLVERTTKDLDIVALLSPSNTLESAKPLPAELLAAAAQASRELGLGENWLNSDAGELIMGTEAGGSRECVARSGGIKSESAMPGN